MEKKTNLTWYFPQATPPYVAAAEKAFNVWQQNSKFTFKRVTIPVPSPDITITIVNEKHQFRANFQGNRYCDFNFDGPVKVLAHAYFPSEDGCIEIHFDRNERWNPNIDGIVQDTETSFFMVLAHEFGHTLGIGHSDVPTAIMYPWFQKNFLILHSEYVKDYLPQKIPFEPISHIFKNSAGNLFAFNKLTGDCYTTSFPDLTILEINKVPIPTNSKVDVIFQTNSGQIFVFYDQAYYIEFNDGFKKILNRGRVSDRFLGLPKNPTAAFRYIDGYIYFFTQDTTNTTTSTTYYKFSEYSRSVVSSGPFDWNLFYI
ncbi:interstitial collagenase-like [Diorhabda sublineata]|uniref:interstitial collagenase-like n=1 Tax=Diorhabda sublineata TaxID=1163346 RepID=UPI0024E07C04|nr:interstitial collagenase-like [Diorhabda sublineata]